MYKRQGLHGVNDLFYIRFGKFLGQIGGEQTGQWFRQYNAGGAGIPIGKKDVYKRQVPGYLENSLRYRACDPRKIPMQSSVRGITRG